MTNMEKCLTKEEIKDIKEAQKEIKQGKTISIETIAKKYRIKLKTTEKEE